MNDEAFIKWFKATLYEAVAKELVAMNSQQNNKSLTKTVKEGKKIPNQDNISSTDIVKEGKKNNLDDVEWITVKGNHISIKKGQTKEQAVKEFLESKRSEMSALVSDVKKDVKKAVKDVYKSYKEANCESPEPSYHYPKSIAGANRGKPMTFAQADNGRANPHFDSNNYAYSHNCQSCVVAHEARMRGYNVQAAPRRTDNKTNELANHTSWAWIDPQTGKKCEDTKINVSNAKEHFNYLEKNIKPGARYQLTYYWEDKKDNKTIKHGHILCITRNKYGELQMYDPQVNAIYAGKNIEKYFNNPRMIFSETHLKPRILRVDDKKFNPYFMNDVLKKY